MVAGRQLAQFLLMERFCIKDGVNVTSLNQVLIFPWKFYKSINLNLIQNTKKS